jgi:hypothetical protein
MTAFRGPAPKYPFTPLPEYGIIPSSGKNMKVSKVSMLVLLGLFAALPAGAAKKPGGAEKKAERGTKKKTTSKAKASTATSSSSKKAAATAAAAEVSAPYLAEDVSATTTTAIVTQVAATAAATDPTAAIRDLTSKMHSFCIIPKCAGDVEYERCFQQSKMTQIIDTDSTCASIMAQAPSEQVKAEVKAQLYKKIKSALNDMCKEADGKVSGAKCRITVTYKAKADTNDKADGEESEVVRSIEFDVGQTVNCDYLSFGLDDQQMQYKTKWTAEQRAVMIQGGIEVGMGALNLGMQLVANSQAKKELKSMSRGSDEIWKYTASGGFTKDASKSEKCPVKHYFEKTFGKDDYFKEKCGSGYAKGSDAGGDYCTPSGSANCDVVSSQSCESKTALTGSEECFVKIAGANTETVAAKKAELMQKFNSLEDLRLKANKSEDDHRMNQWIKGMALQGVAGAGAQNITNIATGRIKTDGQGNILSNQAETNRCSGGSGDIQYFGSQQITETVGNRITTTNKPCQRVALENNFNPDQCGETSQGGCACIKIPGCKYDRSTYSFIPVSSSGAGTSYASYQAVDTMAIKNEAVNMRAAIAGVNEAFTDTYQDDLANYNKAEAALISAQGTVTSAREEKQALRSQVEEGTQTAISATTDIVVNKGLKMLMTGIEAGQNRAVRTGACYIGTTPWARDGERKKLGWRN